MTAADLSTSSRARPGVSRTRARLVQLTVAALATVTIAGAAALGDGAASAGRSGGRLAIPPIKGGPVQKVTHFPLGAPIVSRVTSGGPANSAQGSQEASRM